MSSDIGDCKRLYLVNADDFGSNANFNAAIVESFRQKLIDRTTIMANMPAFQEAVSLAKEHHLTDQVGMHLTLTCGEPLTDRIRNNRILCSREGEFINSRKKFLLCGAREVEQIQEEFTAQLNRCREAGLPIKHVDSHHHVHEILQVWWALEDVLKKSEVTSVRLTRNFGPGLTPLHNLYKTRFNRNLNRIGLTDMDYFGDVEDYLYTLPSLKTHLNTWCEVMIHPSLQDDLLCDMDGVAMELKLKDIRNKPLRSAR